MSEFLPLLLEELKHNGTNIIHDGRLLTPEKSDEFIKSVQELGRPIWMVDVHCSLTTSLVRLLLRTRTEDDPIPELDVVVEGYVQSIKYRRQIVNSYLVNAMVVDYFLLKGVGKTLVAQKIGQQLVVTGTNAQKLFTTPTKEKIKNTLNAVITDAFIIKAIAKGYIPADKIHLVSRWKGFSLQQAVFQHIAEINPAKPAVAVAEVHEDHKNKFLEGCDALKLHLETERKLHVRGTDDYWDGWHWPVNYFKWNINPKYKPEDMNLMALGYFVIPYGDFLGYGVTPFQTDIFEQLTIVEENETPLYARDESASTFDYYFPFFVHPESYAYFQRLFNGAFRYVEGRDSEYIGIPTSSFRSWLMQSTDGTTPFIVKFGVMEPNEKTSKMITESELKHIGQNQVVFKELSKSGKFSYFPENLGFKVKDYGSLACMIIREIPEDLLEDRVKIISFGSLISMERTRAENHGLAKLKNGFENLPLIFEIISTAIEHNQVKNSVEFIRRYLIHEYLDAIEEVHMKKGKSFSPHTQNMCMRIKNNLPSGFVYRDFEGVFKRGEKYLETHSWFYRYYIFIKLLNLLLDDQDKYFYLPNSPILKGKPPIQMERALYNEFKVPLNLSITKCEYLSLLKELDQAYLDRLCKYFDLSRVNDLTVDGFIPGSEPDSTGSIEMNRLNQELWKARYIGESGVSDVRNFKLNGRQLSDVRQTRESRRIASTVNIL